jgi:hypothetical protein
MRFELFVATRYLRAKRRQVEAVCGGVSAAGARSRNPERSEGPLNEI